MRVGAGWRACLYAAGFIALAIVALPALFYQIDIRWPALHVELGPVRWAGLVILLAGLGGYLGSISWLVRQGDGPFMEFDPPRRLVCTGPYRWVRNPIADSVAVMLFGEAVLFSSTGMGLYLLLVIAVGMIQIICIEEPRLTARFGDAYRQYCLQVPRWLPRRPGKDGPARR